MLKVKDKINTLNVFKVNNRHYKKNVTNQFWFWLQYGTSESRIWGNNILKIPSYQKQNTLLEQSLVLLAINYTNSKLT